MYTSDAQGRLAVAGIAPGAPAERGGLKVGDLIVEVAGEKPESLADLWRRVWALGPSGTPVEMKFVREGKTAERRLLSADRTDFLKKPHLH